VGAPDLAKLAALVAVALALRLAVVAATPGLELYGDQEVYAAEAAQILAGETTDAYRGPGYPAFLAASQGLFGRGDVAPRVGNAIAGALLVAVFFALVRAIATPRAAWIAAIALAVYPRAVFLPAYLFAENLYALLLVFGLWMALRASEGDRRASAIAAGIALGLGVLTREMLLAFVPVVALVLVVARSPLALRERAIRAALLVAAVAAVVAPWTLRNHRVHGTWMLVGYSDGTPWFEGNYLAPTPMDVFRERVSRTNRYIEEAERAGVEPEARRVAIANERLQQDAWEAIRARQPAWIFEKLATNLPRALRPNVKNEVLIGRWPMPPERQSEVARALLLALFLPAHVLLLVLGPIGLAQWRLAGAAILPLLYLGFSLAVHVAANAAHYRFEYPYEWVLLAGVAIALDGGLPKTRARRIAALAGVAIAVGSQLVLRDVWMSGFW